MAFGKRVYDVGFVAINIASYSASIDLMSKLIARYRYKLKAATNAREQNGIKLNIHRLGRIRSEMKQLKNNYL